MNKKLKGYMSLEASFVMPVVIALYILIIMAGFFLYDRCVISQDSFLLALRGSRFTEAMEQYGEVIYGESCSDGFQRNYIKERQRKKEAVYPFYRPEERKTKINGNRINVVVKGNKGTLNIEKEAEIWNPVKMMKEKRRELFGSKIL